MKDLIDKILKYLPQYLSDFGYVFASPKRFMAERNSKPEDTLSQSLIFLAISLVLRTIMTAPLLPPGRELWAYTAAEGIRWLLIVCLAAITLHFAWRIVGGRASTRSFFVTYAYFFGVAVLILTAFLLLSEGFFKVCEPDLYAKVIEAKLKKQPMPNVSGGWVHRVSFIILVIGYCFTCVWTWIGWGAYRELNGLNKIRSFFAFMIFGLLSWPMAAIAFFIGRAMS